MLPVSSPPGAAGGLDVRNCPSLCIGGVGVDPSTSAAVHVFGCRSITGLPA